jgi:hypothetical protein
MADKLTALEVNAETGKSIERELTAEEISERNAMASQEAQWQIETEAKQAARTSALAKLAALGLTESEIAAL